MLVYGVKSLAFGRKLIRMFWIATVKQDVSRANACKSEIYSKVEHHEKAIHSHTCI
jgi:hypothetical protein